MVRADRTQLDQVLINLCTNAFHAMPHGGRLCITTEQLQFDQTPHLQARPGPYLRLSVSDTGVGIAPDFLERIWEPFFTTKKEGTGLGLATVYAIIRRHNGFVTVTSELARGSRFDVHLPLSPVAHKPVQADPLESLGGKETILLVDDEPMLRELIGEGLSTYGYQVLGASDGDQALELFRRKRGEIDLAVVDVVMPQMSGPVLCSQLLREQPDLKLLLMSGHAPEELLDEAAVFPVIPKPFKVPALARRIRQLLAMVPGREGAPPQPVEATGEA
jgi:CheY-like chemotaxis protein